MTSITAGITVRDATEEDVDFISWVMLAASRSHLARGCWEYMYGIDEATALRFLAALAATEQVHLFHHSLFQIAEVEGRPAAAMCGYDPQTHGPRGARDAFERACESARITFDDDFNRRVEVFSAGWTPQEQLPERPWIVENVATHPDFRRRGLADLLLRQTIERGRGNGFRQAQVSVYIGNEAARRAYINSGFVVASEARDPRWDAEIGCPGTETLLQPI